MNHELLKYMNRPELYAKSTAKFWDDEHISKGMLEAHLNPEWEAATRKLDFVNSSVEWITRVAPVNQYTMLLDLGCGPGIYAEKFYQKGYEVTGIDLSPRSISYAKDMANKSHYSIDYRNLNYLDLSYEEEFDLITLIYCDFGVLSNEDRGKVLQNVYRSLKQGGKFIFDVYTPRLYDNEKETKTWNYQDTGFWCEQPHLCLHSLYRYDESNTMLKQTIVVTKEAVNCYNIWEHTFTQEELQNDLTNTGFAKYELYGDVAGKPYQEGETIICAVVTK